MPWARFEFKGKHYTCIRTHVSTRCQPDWTKHRPDDITAKEIRAALKAYQRRLDKKKRARDHSR